MGGGRGRSATDAVIVGGGPAGLAAAIRLREAGARVIVVERRRGPIDKACGEGLMPAGARQLVELGAQPVHAALRGVRNVDGAVSFAAPFPDGAVAWGIRRPALHGALLDRAAAAGVDLRLGVRVEGLVDGGVATSAGPVRADWIIGADGLHSRVRAWAGIRSWPGPRRRFGVRRHYRIRPWSPWIEVHWSDGCEAYVTPVGPEEVGIAVLFDARHRGRFDALLAGFPELRARLAGAAASSADKGAGPMHQLVDRVAAGRVVLIGDAAGYLDALTGEGLTLALQQAEALPAVLSSGRTERWARAHRRIDRVPAALTRVMLLLQRRPALRRRVFDVFARRPDLYGRFLGLEGSPGGLRGALRLAARLLRG